MQYPKFLYKKEQKDYDNPQFEVPETKYWIHTANPFNIVKASKWILKEKPDLVIFPWWHPYFAPCFWICLLYTSLLGIFDGRCRQCLSL